MEKQNKIYVTVQWDKLLGCSTKPYRYCEEFIRKDSLLEWAKDNLLECEASNDDADYGRIDAYKKLIDKLNSM